MTRVLPFLPPCLPVNQQNSQPSFNPLASPPRKIPPPTHLSSPSFANLCREPRRGDVADVLLRAVALLRPVVVPHDTSPDIIDDTPPAPLRPPNSAPRPPSPAPPPAPAKLPAMLPIMRARRPSLLPPPSLATVGARAQ